MPSLHNRIPRRRAPWLIASLSFAAGCLITARLGAAQSNRVFELMVYHTVPGKVPALEDIFREVARLQTKHKLDVVGYWVPNGDDPAWKDTFVYLIAHPSREQAKKNFEAMRADPGFQEMVKSEQADKLVKKVDVTYMRPTDFSAMK